MSKVILKDSWHFSDWRSRSFDNLEKPRKSYILHIIIAWFANNGISTTLLKTFSSIQNCTDLGYIFFHNASACSTLTQARSYASTQARRLRYSCQYNNNCDVYRVIWARKTNIWLHEKWNVFLWERIQNEESSEFFSNIWKFVFDSLDTLDTDTTYKCEDRRTEMDMRW